MFQTTRQVTVLTLRALLRLLWQFVSGFVAGSVSISPRIYRDCCGVAGQKEE